jgi:hypothetical protein
MANKRGRSKGPQPRSSYLVGLDRSRKRRYPCGLCGTKTQLTRTHVPPQCAGNTGLVYRRFWISRDQTLSHGRPQIGGLHVYGLCKKCNGIQALYDPAYCELARALYPCWIRGEVALPGGRMELPNPQIAPGAVARSVLVSMFGLNANLRMMYPQLAESLHQQADSIQLPVDVQLRLALARGTTARVTGPIFGHSIRTRIGFSTMAQIYFPPLAWQLADNNPPAIPNGPSLLDRQGWADVSNWIMSIPADRRNLHSLVRSLPAVVHPTHDARHAEDWSELFADSITFILGCNEVSDFRL